MKLQPYIAAAAALSVVSCSSDDPVYTPPVTPVTSAASATGAHPVAARYVALPGQAAVAVSGDVDDAFDRQAAAYAADAAATSATVGAPDSPAPENPLPEQTTAPTPEAATPAAPEPVDPTPAAPAAPTETTVGEGTATAAPAPAAQENAAPETAGQLNYKIRIKNATPGRIFVEAQDAAGTIYPCGFMEGDRTFTTPMENAAPIKGPITIVVRDPDQPEAPEIRRYKVSPPAVDYNGKAISVDILPGGRYSASLDGQPYYTSPAPIPSPAAPAPPAAE